MKIFLPAASLLLAIGMLALTFKSIETLAQLGSSQNTTEAQQVIPVIEQETIPALEPTQKSKPARLALVEPRQHYARGSGPTRHNYWEPANDCAMALLDHETMSWICD